MSSSEAGGRTLWERFCREEARDVALTFLERVRKFKGRNPSVREVHDTVFTNEFSAAFLEEASVLMTEGDTAVDGSQRSRRESQGTKRGKWWNHIFKWPKLSRERPSESLTQRGGRHGPVILEGILQMLNLTDTMTWQRCKLCLLGEQGNFQLEVYVPPKCSMPKMSLFCFLIEEVRSTSALEMPDSTSCFVIKSQNHEEYVFDAGTDQQKLKWIRTVLQHSGRPQTNGMVGVASTSAAETQQFSLSTTLPRTSPNSISSEELVHTLASSPTVYGRRGNTPTERRLALVNGSAERRLALANGSAEHRLALANGSAGRMDGEGSVLCDVTLRGNRHHSPNRQRKARSMFVETSVSGANQRFPYVDHPRTSTPPPLPRRGPSQYRTTCISPTHQPSAIPSSAHHQTANGRVLPQQQRKHSQPTLDLPSPTEPSASLHELQSLGNLETCSQSSSTSALHPVSIAAVQRNMASRRRGSLSSSSPPEVAKQQLTVQNRERKVSAPVFSRQTLDEATRPAHHHQHSAELLTTAIEAVLESGREGGLEESVEQGDDPPISPVIESSDEQQPVVVAQRQAETVSSSPSRTNSSSSDQTEEEAVSTASNPIYVETTEGQEVSPIALFTHHPYASWATSQRDVDNLRALSQFPWFHGMVSRINASQLVLVDGEEGLGQYLVRQSESREGDFVVTFNYHNRAKHLRMAVDESGCNIQHLWFDNVSSMLEYFKTNSIPLESFWLNDDVKLTTYIDRTASDAFRTTTVVNVDRLSRNPPRRSRSLHLGMAQGTQLSDSSSPGELQPSPSSPSTSSLPHSTHTSTTGWRQFFRSQRSSSAGNVGRIERRHSANAGSVLDTQQRRSRTENPYIARNY